MKNECPAMGRIGFFDPSQPIGHISGNLPHWRQDGTTYFVTFRLGDSMPRAKLKQWLIERDNWIRDHPPPHTPRDRKTYFTLFPARFHHWLDAGGGSCILEEPTTRQIVEDTLTHFDASRYRLGEFIIMPNHVHVVVTPYADHLLSEIIHSWKSFSAHQINYRLCRRGPIWQKESFDHIVRNPQQLERINWYIRNNPLPSR